MLDENHYIAISSATLMHFYDQLEQAYDDEDLEDLDFDEGAGILTIVTLEGATFVVNRHAPTRQIWLASPLSGGLHFDYNHDNDSWMLPDGRVLGAVLREDLKQSCGIQVIL